MMFTGTFLDPNESIESISYTVSRLSVDEKYSLHYYYINYFFSMNII